ncbi:MAG: 4-phosphopantetheinyl transferase, partial [Ginsengibacter sp.]
MPLFYQHTINDATKISIWHIVETEDFFLNKVPLPGIVTHWHKRLQHLAGRYLLQELCPGFPYHLIEIAGTRKPFLANEKYHFSISHCGDYA